MQQTTPLPVLQKAPSLEEIKQTREAIAGFIHRTPVMRSEQINSMLGVQVFFKCENFQKIGAFKMRGAASAAIRLDDDQKQLGLCTHSSGNHAQAVARSAKLLGIPAYIVMPENAPEIKRKATRGYGANIIPCGPTPADREAMLEKVQAKTGAYFIHPYNDFHVIAGQATAGLELWEQAGPFDSVWAPIGGGGLMSGTALSIKALSDTCQVIGTEPERVNDAYRSFHSGQLETNERIDTIADGLRTHLGEKTLAVIREHVDQVYTVEEDEIILAMRLIWERMKIIIEPSCAVPLAALIKHRKVFQGQRIGMILTGGNVDLDHLPFQSLR